MTRTAPVGNQALGRSYHSSMERKERRKTVTAKHVSDVTRRATWELMLDLERQFRYYGRLGDRYAVRHRAFSFLFLMGILVEGALIYFLSAVPIALWTFAGIGALILGYITIVDVSMNHAEKSAALRAVAADCDDLKSEAEQLWRDIESFRVDDHSAEDRYNRILDRWFRATRRITLETHHHDNVQAAEEACKALADRYA